MERRRLRADPIFTEIERASERFHEIPHSSLVNVHSEIGYIDLLYRDENGWQIVDFKTDTIHSDEQLAKLTEEYAGQMIRYMRAIETLWGKPARVRICFLDDRGKVVVTELQG